MSAPTLEAPVTIPQTIPNEPIYRLSVGHYHQMVQAGILTEDDKVELLEGWLIEQMPKNSPHTYATRALVEALSKWMNGYFVSNQEPITTPDSEPEPDVCLVKGDWRDYAHRHPTSDEVALVIEVADSTLTRDRTTKQRIYVRAGIPVYWIVNLTERLIEVYTQPIREGAVYATQKNYAVGELVPVVIADETVGTIAVSEVLG